MADSALEMSSDGRLLIIVYWLHFINCWLSQVLWRWKLTSRVISNTFPGPSVDVASFSISLSLSGRMLQTKIFWRRSHLGGLMVTMLDSKLKFATTLQRVLVVITFQQPLIYPPGVLFLLKFRGQLLRERRIKRRRRLEAKEGGGGGGK